jgi:CRISPR-associated exonuclease Cas4
MNWLALGATFALLALFAWLWARGQRAQAGLPQGRVIFADTGTWFPQKQPLYSESLQLVGRPDYLVQEAGGAVIPVEVKSSQAPSAPHEGHLFQLAAYCLLVQENYGYRPDYGIIQYNDRAFAVDFTPELEADLLDVLAEMRGDLFEDELDRDHNDERRCAACGLRDHCFQRLA